MILIIIPLIIVLIWGSTRKPGELNYYSPKNYVNRVNSLIESGNLRYNARDKRIVLYMPQSQLREDAAYNYIICCDKVFNELNLPLEEPKVSIKQVKELKDLVVACNNFLKWYPESKKEPEIKLKLGEIFYRKKLYDMGEKYVQSALESINKHKRGAEHRVSALILLMQLNFAIDLALQLLHLIHLQFLLLIS